MPAWCWCGGRCLWARQPAAVVCCRRRRRGRQPPRRGSQPPASLPCPPAPQPNWSKSLLLLLAERVTRGDPRFAWCYSTPVAEVRRRRRCRSHWRCLLMPACRPALPAACCHIPHTRPLPASQPSLPPNHPLAPKPRSSLPSPPFSSSLLSARRSRKSSCASSRPRRAAACRRCSARAAPPPPSSASPACWPCLRPWCSPRRWWETSWASPAPAGCAC